MLKQRSTGSTKNCKTESQKQLLVCFTEATLCNAEFALLIHVLVMLQFLGVSALDITLCGRAGRTQEKPASTFNATDTTDTTDTVERIGYKLAIIMFMNPRILS